MALVRFDQHDHPAANPFLPQVGCGICGHVVQPKLTEAMLATEGSGPLQWDEIAPGDQVGYMAEMESWSQRHALEHDELEHGRYQERIGHV